MERATATWDVDHDGRSGVDRWGFFAGAGSGGAAAVATRDPTALPAACGGLRVRREPSGRDAINSRAWDIFHATPPTQTASADLLRRGAPVVMDMNPIASRTNTAEYRLQPAYIPDPPRGAASAGDLGVPPPAGRPTLPSAAAGFYGNPYTQRLDSDGADARNMIRELRSAVVEDNRERQVDASRALASRQFYDRWLPQQAATDASALQAYELLRPRTDDWRNAWAGEDRRDE
jgi:hypothetical protein